MKYITYIGLAVVMLCLSCSSRREKVEIPIDISALGDAEEYIQEYETATQPPFDYKVFAKLNNCLDALENNDVVQRTLEEEDIVKLHNYLYQKVVVLLEQEFQEGFCNNRHDYFAKLRAAVDTLQTKYRGIPQEQQQTLAKLADWYQRHQNACSAGLGYPSKQPSSLLDKYNVAQAERLIQSVKSRQAAYSHSSRCNECKNYSDKVKGTLSGGHYSFVSNLVDLYEKHSTRDSDIERNIQSEISLLPSGSKKEELLGRLRAIATNKAQAAVDSTHYE